MASAGPDVSEVEEALRARANARRIKEHYDGTLGVPSGLQSLSHLLAHDKDAVFSGLEHLPFYNKTDLPPPPPLHPAPEPLQRPQPPRRRTPVHPISMPSFNAHLLASLPTSMGPAGAPPPPSPSPSPPLESNLWTQDPVSPTSPAGAAAATTDAVPSQEYQPPASTAPTAPLDEQQMMYQYPLEPGSGPKSGGRVRLPSGFTLDPWRWTPNEEELGQAFDAATTPPNLSESILTYPTDNRQNGYFNHHNHQPHGRGSTATDGGSSPVHLVRRPESRTGGSGGAASPPPLLQRLSSSPTSSPPRAVSPVVTTGQTRGSQSGGLYSPAGGGGDGSGSGSVFGGFHRSQGGGGTGFGSGNGSGSRWGTPTATGFGSMPSMSSPPLEAVGPTAAAETEEERKARLARQRLLSANDLTPQEWARIGPPKDAADLEKFVARSYSMAVDFDRHTLLLQRVARPDIFHISAAEAQRRQLAADEATLAMQAMRRAEEEARQAAEEQERQARNAPRGPWYDTLGVRQVNRSTSPVLPRFLDWHPSGGVVGGGSGSGGGSGGGGGGGGTAGSSPRGSRCASAARSGSESLYGTGRGCGATRRFSAQDHVLRQSEPIAGSDPYVYEDYGEDPDLPAGGGAAYGTRPPRRRHHSAIAASNSFAPPPRPAGVSDAHYAQMVRQQRKWLNGPAQPPRPVSAAPLPAPMSRQYVRPRSSRPWPDGTAAPIPSRVAAEAAAAAAAAEAASRPSTAFRTIIHPKSKQLPPRPGDAGRTSFRTLSTRTSAKSCGIVNTAAFISAVSAAFPSAPGGKVPPPRHVVNPQDKVDGGGRSSGAAAAELVAQLPSSVSEAPPPAQLDSAVMPSSAQLTLDSSRGGKRLPWEAREHVAAPHYSSPPAAAAGPVPAAEARRSSSVFGETLPPGGSGGGRDGDESFVPRKFELREGLVLDGYMGR
ncbi:hypothetical protein VOLCADRAFT_108001 [Volvox carteri f. nagariensis]|uniref:Uncharacterized protein n=1 Tax=Volvox carteri f. nagariensis TaxID=3068 RepID=D8UHP1_VOLCA|nr:uncharacterized protein VOLCADRAFT_108001 [Volvox carteri f. nagariensis]EFJ40783.1 hypothetical protein VOLCADRAFT_108001 [Volvox carteri f. nagariensis]|eukprot:XP_002958158.1 hypothetical protein VOLCADRAFT_108001 [Volvox carteri f. nagariensis]